jgi:hypothetical protein
MTQPTQKRRNEEIEELIHSKRPSPPNEMEEEKKKRAKVEVEDEDHRRFTRPPSTLAPPFPNKDENTVRLKSSTLGKHIIGETPISPSDLIKYFAQNRH